MRTFKREVEQIRKRALAAVTSIQPDKLILVFDDGFLLDGCPLKNEELAEALQSKRNLTIRLIGQTTDNCPSVLFLQDKGVFHTTQPLSIEEWAVKAEEQKHEY
ncbi:hypothetical protein [Marispirochaeta sp.]|uniref:hypothetical protein n=1 Tax=Marispirochaeta sp. TaxID=2038653 RepID=UPI0029C7B8D6|nr:hypothetical protein [Marispirochaeta sp.]